MRRRIVPLANFDSEVERHDFGNGYSLEPLQVNEVNLIGQNPTILHNFLGRNWDSPKFKLVTASAQEPTYSLGITSEPSIDIIRAMRLCHAGDICAPIFLDFDLDDARYV